MKKTPLFFLSFLLFSPLFSLKAGATPFFDDKGIPDYAREAVQALYDRAIMKGYPDGNFGPSEEINRAQFAKIIVEATGTKKYLPLQGVFPDVKPSDWFFPYVETARINGWLNGYSDGLFKPAEVLNRAEAAKILVNAFGLPTRERDGTGWYQKYFDALGEKGFLAYQTSAKSPGAGINPSRAEIAEQIYRLMRYKESGVLPDPVSSEEAQDEVTAETEVDNDDAVSAENSEDSVGTIGEDGFKPTDYAPQKQALTDYSYKDADALYQRIDPKAGKMYLEKVEKDTQRVVVSPGQSNVELLRLKLTNEGGTVRVKEFQVKLMNTQKMFLSRIWVSQTGKRISAYLIPKGDLIILKLESDLVLAQGNPVEIVFQGNVASDAVSGASVRAVLHLPTWISANTNKKIGFFPFGGNDLVVK